MLQEDRPHQEIPAARPSLKYGFFRAVARNLKSFKLGDLLVVKGVITPEQLRTALQDQKETGEQLGRILVRQGRVTAAQLYQKLAEQWCLKAAAAGITVMMQVTASSVARAEDDDNSTGITAVFTMAAANVPSAYRNIEENKQYPELFGTSETRSDDITAFKKWTEVMKRFEDQAKTLSSSSPRVMLWRAEIQKLKGKSDREKIDGINNYLNKIPYIEDTGNYGKSDYWATPLEFLTRGGDCEDFAIAKYASLRMLGFSTDQLRIAIVQDKVKNIPHAILVVYSDEGNFVLDNQDKRVEYVADVQRYKPIFSINSSSWWLHKA